MDSHLIPTRQLEPTQLTCSFSMICHFKVKDVVASMVSISSKRPIYNPLLISLNLKFSTVTVLKDACIIVMSLFGISS